MGTLIGRRRNDRLSGSPTVRWSLLLKETGAAAGGEADARARSVEDIALEAFQGRGRTNAGYLQQQLPLRPTMEELKSCAEVAEVLPGRFVFAALKTYEGFRRLRQAATCICYSIDNELVYEPFASDFGPLNMGCTYRFCHRTAELLQEAKKKNRLLLYYCGPQPDAKANAAVLVGAFQVLMLGRTPEVAHQCIRHMEPFLPFRDASPAAPCFHLTVLSTIQGLGKAQSQGMLDLKSYDIVDYETYEKVENGDSTWILPGKLLAFSGPAALAEVFYGYKTKVPEDYLKYFKAKGVSAVVRLNKPLYKSSRFTVGGLRHYELYFPDGSCPSEQLVDRFLEIAEAENGALAIHCKAGLGRTGVLICCYLMKHHGFTAKEALGYIRVCRPGSVIGPQQNYIVTQESRMHAAGEACRKAAASKLGFPPGLQKVINISASCRAVDTATEAVSNLQIEPKTPAQSSGSRLSALLKFAKPSTKAGSSVARATAPNGQPRKIPAALLAAGTDGLRAFAADEDQPNSAKSEQWTITSSTLADCAVEEFSPLGAAIKARE